MNQSEMHRDALANTWPLGSDYMVYSRDMPVLLEDSGMVMDQPFLVSIMTAGAVQAIKCVPNQELGGAVRDTVKKRIRKVIHLAILHGTGYWCSGRSGAERSETVRSS
jgi:uncharacterized protein (TIGR02452 family)